MSRAEDHDEHGALAAYLESLSGTDPLSREGEMEQFAALLEAERNLRTSLLEGPFGLALLRDLGQELARGLLRAADLSAAASGDDFDEHAERDRFLRQIAELQRWPADAHASRELIRSLGLSRRAVLRVAQQFVREEPSAPAEHRELVRDVAIQHARAEKAKAVLAAANLRLVLRMARRYLGRGLPLLDLIQEGNLGLLRAIDGFDPSRGNRLATYAVWWIRQAMRHALAEQARVIRVPRHLLETLQSVQRYTRGFVGRHGRPPSAEEAAAGLGLPLQSVERALDAMRDTVSYDAPVNQDGRVGLGDLIADEDAGDPGSYLLVKDFAQQARDALSVLDGEERRVLELRFGIGAAGEHSVEEAAEELAISRDRVRELEARAIRKLQRTRAARGLRVYARD